MKCLSILFLICFNPGQIFGQLEISSGYAVNRNLADGAPIHFAYELKIKNRIYTKPQIGFKHLYYFNNFVGATLKVNIFEFHQTVSYQVIKKRTYIFQPNIGLNFRHYEWKGEMKPPLNTLPQRVYNIEFRHDRLLLNSFDNGYTDTYKVSNLGFSIQLQNQFRLKETLWLSVTPFLEPDYDRSQNTGGCYVGLVFKNL